MLRTVFLASTTPSVFLEKLLPELHKEYGHHFTTVVAAPMVARVELTGGSRGQWLLEVDGEDLAVTPSPAGASPVLVVRVDTDAWERGKAHLQEFREDLEDLLDGPAWRPALAIDAATLAEAARHPVTVDFQVTGSSEGPFGATIQWGEGKDPIHLTVTVDVRVVEDILGQCLDPADLRRPDRVSVKGEVGRLTALGSVVSRLKGRGGR